eukprot:TRINITY_DN22968_c0_g2_i2.p2 TRINITY_DN22968_c0_g2~~TRINITY_DN22968_c0_g2_i2.p2  ORF type:complete len:107 (+),score=0.39 TRINITY_DN22968_c0_g2_i2:809-1129(+)
MLAVEKTESKFRSKYKVRSKLDPKPSSSIYYNGSKNVEKGGPTLSITSLSFHLYYLSYLLSYHIQKNLLKNKYIRRSLMAHLILHCLGSDDFIKESSIQIARHKKK